MRIHSKSLPSSLPPFLPPHSLFFHYSGHGGSVRDQNGDEADEMDETILPIDHERAGHILDDEIHEIMVRPLHRGVRLTAVFDSCHRYVLAFPLPRFLLSSSFEQRRKPKLECVYSYSCYWPFGGREGRREGGQKEWPVCLDVGGGEGREDAREPNKF